MRCRGVATRVSLWVDLRQRFANRARAVGPYEPGGFPAVAQEHERGPQFHAERASEAPAARVGDLDMAHAGMRGESVGDERLGALVLVVLGCVELE